MVNPVYFYVPNLIGYTRIILACAAFYVCFENHLLFFGFYAASQLLDAVDGNVARWLGQATRYGAVLDMVTDRSSTAALLAVLAYFYPDLILVFAFLIALDITSHYAHLYSSLIGGKSSHKTTSADQFALLRLYYGNKWVLFWLCVGNEATLLGLYLMHFTKGPAVPGVPLPLLGREGGLVEWAMLLWTPLGLIKQLMNVVQLMQAGRDIAKFDVAERAKNSKKQK